MLNNIEPKNIKRKFDSLQKKRLGTYVYGLRDPRDGKIFYVGQGSGDRVFQHFSEAEGLINGTQKFTSKRIRIIDIWNAGEDVDWIILAHNLPPETVNYVESVAIDSLSVSQNGQVLNDVSGPWSSMLNHGQIDVFGAKPVNPKISYSQVFIFPIHNALKESSKSVYESTRAAWSINQKFQSKDSIAVGLQNGISIGSFKVDVWENHGDKQAFVGVEYKPLLNYDWKNVISHAMGYWQRGNHLIVEFNGRGSFRFLYGCSDKSWIILA